MSQNGKWWSKWWIILSGYLSKWEVADNFEWWCVKVESGSQSGKEFEVVICQNGKWQSQWQTILSGGVLKWEVAVKVAKNLKWWCVKMGSGGQKQHIILTAAVPKW